VIEVGLGGRLDATNVVTPVASIITRIDLITKIIWGIRCGKSPGRRREF